ncbi:MAG: hypothetical protein JF589_14715, partial [Gemmatimonadetes bacterium]|nr:hypothetical protein [Gemmatimonadota bacterium]
AQRAAAQTSSFDAPPVGARVRVSRTGAAPTTGTVLARASDSIVVGQSDGVRQSIAMKDVTELEISRGRSRHVVVGTALGLVAGGVGGLLIKQNGDRVTRTEAIFKSTDPNNLYLQAALGDASTMSTRTEHGNSMWIPIGAVAGTATGTLVGYLWKERWRPAAIRRGDARVGVVPTSNPRRVALALSAHF